MSQSADAFEAQRASAGPPSAPARRQRRPAASDGGGLSRAGGQSVRKERLVDVRAGEAVRDVERVGDDTDRRRKNVKLTPRGIEALAMSAMIFDEIRQRWRDELGADREAALERDLMRMVPGDSFRLDVPGWFGGAEPGARSWRPASGPERRRES